MIISYVQIDATQCALNGYLSMSGNNLNFIVCGRVFSLILHCKVRKVLPVVDNSLPDRQSWCRSSHWRRFSVIDNCNVVSTFLLVTIEMYCFYLTILQLTMINKITQYVSSDYWITFRKYSFIFLSTRKKSIGFCV